MKYNVGFLHLNDIHIFYLLVALQSKKKRKKEKVCKCNLHALYYPTFFFILFCYIFHFQFQYILSFCCHKNITEKIISLSILIEMCFCQIIFNLPFSVSVHIKLLLLLHKHNRNNYFRVNLNRNVLLPNTIG